MLICRSRTLATQFNQLGITIPVFLFVWWFPEVPGDDGLNKQRGTTSTTCGLCLSSACCCCPVRSCLAASTDHRDQAAVRDAFFHCPCFAVIFTPVGQTFLRCKSKTLVAICCLHGGVLNIFTVQAVYCRAFCKFVQDDLHCSQSSFGLREQQWLKYWKRRSKIAWKWWHNNSEHV